MKQTGQSKKSERGQSLVELAVSLVALLILLAGIADLGRIALAYMSIRDAAQEGATYASFSPADTAGITARVQQSASGTFGPGAVNVVLAYTPSNQKCMGISGGADNGVLVTVQANNFPITMPFMGAIIGQTINLRASASDTILGPACP